MTPPHTTDIFQGACMQMALQGCMAMRQYAVSMESSTRLAATSLVPRYSHGMNLRCHGEQH